MAYSTEEKRKEYSRQYYIKNKKKILEKQKKYHEENKERKAEYQKKYYEENKERFRERNRKSGRRRYYENQEKYKEYTRIYYQEHKEEINQKAHDKLYSDPLFRAYTLLYEYNRADIKSGRGEGDLTPEWIVENIFTKPCVHCGESNWRKIGCNRLDNTKPHSKDNVEPCCHSCNSKANALESARDLYGKFKIQMPGV